MKTKMSIVLVLGLSIVFAAYLGAEEGSKGPGMRTLGSLSDQYLPVAFDHAKHVSIAGTCGGCHHHGDGNTSSCKECHSLSPSAFKNSVAHTFMPCSNCHGALDPENPAMPGLKVAYHKKCFECHRGMGNIGLDPKGCTELCHAKKMKTAKANVRH